jgi:hypothetical protein
MLFAGLKAIRVGFDVKLQAAEKTVPLGGFF